MIKRFSPLIALLLAMWIVYLSDPYISVAFTAYGLAPRTVDGLVGVATWPLLHGSYAHIANNSIGLALFGGIVCARNRATFLRLTLFVWVVAGVGVWLVGRGAVHIGASGLVFGYFGYVITRGLYDKSALSLIISFAVMLAFGSLIWGVFPSDPRISWEGHLSGFLVGSFFAQRSRRKGYR